MVGFACLLTRAGIVDAQRGRDSTVMLKSASACGTCRIELVPEVSLRPPTDSFWFGPAPRLVRTPSGALLAEMEGTRSPGLFAANGRFERALMKVGDGPAEIGRAGAGFFGVAPNGDTWVFDGGKGGARHVFDRVLKYVRTDPGAEFKAAQSGYVAPNGEIVFAARIATRERAGQPLHVAGRTGAILRSFGRDDPTLSPRLPRDSVAFIMLRRVEPGPNQTFWSYTPSQFFVERWTTDGRRPYRVEHAMDGWYADVTRELQRLKAPAYAAAERLSLSYVKESATPDLAWFIYVVRTSAQPIDPDSPRMHKGIDIVVEAVDVRAGVVLAVRRFPDTNIQPVWNAPDRVAVVIPYGSDFTSFRISRLNLVRAR